MTRALIVVGLLLSACSASNSGTGGGTASGGGTGGAGGNTGGGSASGGGSAAGGGTGTGGGTSMGPGGGNAGVGGGAPVTFTKCAAFSPPTALVHDTVTELSLSAGRAGEAFVAWSGQNTGLNAIHQFVDGGWAPPFFESDGGQQFVQLVASEDGEAHSVMGFTKKYYFHAAGNGSFTVPATRPYVMPEISAGGVAVSYNQNGFPDQLWFQKRGANGVWPTGAQMLTSDAGTPSGTTYIAANGDAYILWSNTYVAAPLDGGPNKTHRHFHLTRRSAAGIVTGTIFLTDETRFVSSTRNFQAQHLMAFVDTAAQTFEIARLGLDGQLTDRRGFSGELVAFHIADDGSARLVWYAAASGLTLEVQPAPGGQWTNSVLKALANGGTSNATRADTTLAFGPSGDGYQLENENNGARFHAAHISKTGTVTAAAQVVPGLEGGGSPKKIAVGRDGHLFVIATGSLGADAGFGPVMRGTVCE